jgi:D-alanine--poly(phosphoribitol) ligase subunit 1
VSLLERIDHWATVAPDAIAHVSGDKRLSFGELAARSSALAAKLQERYGVNRSAVAVLGHREPEMLIAFIGAVKSGRPYIPIDSTLPRERIDEILAKAQPLLMLTPTEVGEFSKLDKRTPLRPVEPEDPFYIIFTSGSTGTPKGIVITLGCLEHFVNWMLSEQRFAERGEIFLNQAPFSFDLSVMDAYCSLVTGGTLFSVGRDLMADPKSLYQALAGSNVTVWISTPSFVEMCLVERKFNQEMLQRVRRFLFCGETLLPRTAGLLLERFLNAEIWNFYGPTEATVATTSIQIDRDVLKKYSALPVGRPMPGTDIFLVGSNCEIVSPGSRGEIVIKGANVSVGYVGQPDLTAARFFNENGRRAYRTGDLGRFRDGLLFFEGRMDDQIKLTGYRIELADIESNLRALPMVRDAVVLPFIKNGKVQWLAGFVVLSATFNAEDPRLTNTLRHRLAERLPAYMLPRKFIFTDAFPMTPNGKIDRQKLAKSL